MSLLTKENLEPVVVSFNAKLGECDWDQVTQDRLGQQYPDMTIKKLPRDGEQFNFLIQLKSGKTDRSVVLGRFYEYLRRTPSMKVWDLEVKPYSKRS